jgi:hypothetical protein
MPHNEPCPACGCQIPDWHWEWHAEPGFSEIYRGTAGMECPACDAVVMYTRASVPLTACSPGSQVRRLKRDATKAAIWSRVSNNGMPLKDYLATVAGQMYANYWMPAEVQLADQQAAALP